MPPSVGECAEKRPENKKAYNNSKKLDFSQKTSYYIYNFFKKNKKNVFFENKL